MVAEATAAIRPAKKVAFLPALAHAQVISECFRNCFSRISSPAKNLYMRPLLPNGALVSRETYTIVCIRVVLLSQFSKKSTGRQSYILFEKKKDRVVHIVTVLFATHGHRFYSISVGRGTEAYECAIFYVVQSFFAGRL